VPRRDVEVAAPEPGLTGREIVRRAEALKRKLREQQEESELRGHHSEELHRDFLEAGFYRMVQPRRFGGYELDFPTFWKAMVKVSEGDPGTGWCLTLASHHAWAIGSHWPERAQREIFGADGDFRGPHRPTPAGTARRVEGGYMVTGQWDYCSGAPYATHMIGGAVVVGGDPGEPPAMLQVVVPRAGFTVLDDWGGGEHLGMQSSGSHSVRVEEAFVPEHWAIGLDLMGRGSGSTPGTELHGNPMYLGRFGGVYHCGLVVSVVGAAKATLEEFERTITTRKTLMPPQVMRSAHHDYQRTYGLARGMADSAENLLYRIGEVYMELAERWAETGEPFTLEDDVRLWAMGQQAGKLAGEAVELLFRSASSSSSKRGHPLQRYYRDVAMYRQHIAAQYLNLSTEFAKVHFGLPFGLPG
jgi:3-hydroxy-9,10-secoandrosta-1,3,5(10)-triene-9,17-dione monooxygenase